jgi:hypothetical protein
MLGFLSPHTSSTRRTLHLRFFISLHLAFPISISLEHWHQPSIPESRRIVPRCRYPTRATHTTAFVSPSPCPSSVSAALSHPPPRASSWLSRSCSAATSSLTPPLRTSLTLSCPPPSAPLPPPWASLSRAQKTLSWWCFFRSSGMRPSAAWLATGAARELLVRRWGDGTR